MGNKEVEKCVSKIKGRKYAGSSTKDAKLYHDLPFEGLDDFDVHRGRTRARIDKLRRHYNPAGKRILDIGCSVGGISLGMAEKGAEHVLGVDYDEDSIKVAQAAAKHLKMDNKVEFKVQDITIEWVKSLPRFDLIIWLSNWMWVVKQHGMEYAQELLFEVSKKTDHLYFESAADDGMARIQGATQDDIQIWLKQFTVYRKLRRYPPVGGWMHRDLFLMYLPLVKIEGGKRATTSTIERLDAFRIKKTFQTVWKWQLERELEAYNRLSKYNHYPKIHSYDKDEGSMIMDYAGASEWIEWSKYKDQALEILDELKSVNVTHRDIRHGQFVELNNKLSLVDFGWAIFDDEKDSPTPANKSMMCRRGVTDKMKIESIFGIKK